MKHNLIRTCQITFIAAVALLYVWKVSGGFYDAWKEVSEVNATFTAEQREQLYGVTRTIGDDRVVFLFPPEMHFILYRDEQGAEHVVHDSLHFFHCDRALDFSYAEELPSPKEKTLSPTPERTAALNALRRTPAYPLTLRDRIGLALDIMALWW